MSKKTSQNKHDEERTKRSNINVERAFADALEAFEDDLDEAWDSILTQAVDDAKGAERFSLQVDEIGDDVDAEEETRQMSRDDLKAVLPDDLKAVLPMASSGADEEVEAQSSELESSEGESAESAEPESSEDEDLSHSEKMSDALQEAGLDGLDPWVKEQIDEEDEEGEVKLSARAKAGDYYPQMEPECAEREIFADFRYAAKDCLGGYEAEERREKLRKFASRGLLVALGLMVAVFLVLLAYYIYKHSKFDGHEFAQEYAFFEYKVDWKSIQLSEDGSYIAACGRDAGVLYDATSLQQLASFFPEGDGCRSLSIDGADASIWFMGARAELSMFQPSRRQILASRFVSYRLEDLGDAEILTFGKTSDGFSYLLAQEGDYTWLRQGIDGSVEKVDLEEGAIHCRDRGASQISYVVGDKLKWNVLEEGQIHSGEIAFEPLKGDLLACSYNNDKEQWHLLTSQGILYTLRQNAAARELDLATQFNTGQGTLLMGNNEVIEVISGADWYRVYSPSNIKHVQLAQAIKPTDQVVQSLNLDFPLMAIVDERLQLISHTGELLGVYGDTAMASVRGAYFIGNGEYAAVVMEGGGPSSEFKSLVAIWDIRNARIVKSMGFEHSISGLSVSRKGFLGLVEIVGANSRQILWLDWLTGEKKGEMKTSAALLDVEWSSDETHAILRFEGAKSKLYDLRDAKVEEHSKYEVGEHVTFYREGYILHWSAASMRLVKLDDGAQSIPLLLASTLNLAPDSELKGLRANRHAPYTVVWGDFGLYRYDMEKEEGLWLSHEPTPWIEFSNSGAAVASNRGVWMLGTGQLTRAFALNGVRRFVWSGGDQYILNEEASTAYSVWTGERVEKIGREEAQGIRCFGENCGMHPSESYILQKRGSLVSIENLSQSLVIGVFGGTDSSHWCWMAREGGAQGVGNTCQNINSEQPELLLVPAQDDEVLASVSLASWPRSDSQQQLFRQKDVKFQDWVDFSIETQPSEASLIFAAAEGELPEDFEALQGSVSPTHVRVSRDPRWFAVVITKDGYESVIESFQADRKQLKLSIQLIDSASAAAAISITDEQGVNITQNNADILHTIRKNLSVVRPGLISCMSEAERAQNHYLTMTVDEGGFIDKFSFSGVEITECISAIMSGVLLDPELRGKSIKFEILGEK
ncbi:MAG: hypothetical protein ACOX8U_04945 [Bradymonadia bacterium]|jgi:hypothetical protein